MNVEKYNAGSIVVRGNPKNYEKEFTEIGGKYIEKLQQGGSGWIFPLKDERKVKEFIDSLPTSSDEEKSQKLTIEPKKMYVFGSMEQVKNFTSKMKEKSGLYRGKVNVEGINDVISRLKRCTVEKMVYNEKGILEVWLEKDLPSLDVNFLSLLVKEIYEGTCIKYVTMDGAIYKPRDNVWISKGETQVKKIRDKFCEEDDECIYSPPVAATGPVSYEMYYGEIGTENFSVVVDDIDGKNSQELVDRVEKVLSSDLDSPIEEFSAFDTITLTQNNSEPNDDHRGSDHTEIIIPFEIDYDLPKGFTLRQFIDGLYRIKSHKFDYCYELCHGVNSCDSWRDEDGKVRATVTANFDYGS